MSLLYLQPLTAPLLPPLTVVELSRNAKELDIHYQEKPKPIALGYQFPKCHLFSRNCL